MNTTDIQRLVYKMMTESTGASVLDSGGAYGRHWERNQKKSIQDFINAPAVEVEIYNGGIDYTISLFHFLTDGNALELDEMCNKYNRLKCPDWDSDIYGVSKSQAKWLDKHGFEVKDSDNSYNHDSNLSQVIQYTMLQDLSSSDYVLLQIHNGCDVRGGYTDAKLFKLPHNYLPREGVYGTVKDGDKEWQVSNTYNGYSLTIDDDECSGDALPELSDLATVELSLINSF